MPELPEVETMRRGILPIVGSTINRIDRPPCKCRPILFSPRIDHFNRRASGCEISAVDRLGKRIVIRLNNDNAIVIEPRMTGLVLLADPPGEAHLRMRISLRESEHRQLLFWDRRGLGTVRLLRAGELASLAYDKLGPDALQISKDELHDRLGNSQRAIKVALLDQQIVAGIGNLYAAEILHVAGVDPTCLCNRLSRTQWQRTHAAISLVLDDAILHEGSTLSDGTYRNALNKAGGYQNHHRVYDREGEMCQRCEKTRIRRIVQAQRATFYCPGCQKKRGIHPAVAKEL